MTQLSQDAAFTLGRRPSGLIFSDLEKSFGGYTLFAPQTTEGRVYLVDELGKVAHQWQLPVRAGRDAVLLPTQSQLRAIVESGDNRRVRIGVSPLAANAEVKIDPDRLFGRHLAVLGNTGSGKSCSVAGLIRWSMDEARKARAGADPNARFITNC